MTNTLSIPEIEEAIANISRLLSYVSEKAALTIRFNVIRAYEAGKIKGKEADKND